MISHPCDSKKRNDNSVYDRLIILLGSYWRDNRTHHWGPSPLVSSIMTVISSITFTIFIISTVSIIIQNLNRLASLHSFLSPTRVWNQLPYQNTHIPSHNLPRAFCSNRPQLRANCLGWLIWA
ncbi:unnamed protein product [Rhizophagus irregularis]|nr:unnamed protein product [Rhizophagus irregularis]